MKSIIIIFISLLFYLVVDAQNLIPNPSFEIHDTCPDAPAQLRFCTNWYSPTSTTPDYFFRCTDSSINPPFVQDGIYQWPKNGEGEIVKVKLEFV
ncbi:MAG: hypothetical protein RIQ33_519 [Bacteroidota bacterium]|jgi:hypothetical protein